MSNIFISSTFMDLENHRSAVSDILLRMKLQFSAMEFFGSRTDEAVPACMKEIDECNFFIGIYAWRYGWIPPDSDVSITEHEYNYACKKSKKRLCYTVNENHQWRPSLIDKGTNYDKLEKFKFKISQSVRSKYTTPDNLAKQIAADLSRELIPKSDNKTFGSLLNVNWDKLDSELQRVFLDAYQRAVIGSRDGVVATRHFVAALASIPSTASALLHSLPKEIITELLEENKALDNEITYAEAFQYEKSVSGCVLGSMERLLPTHSAGQRLLAIELAADLLKNGRGDSVAKFRRAGIDYNAVDKLMEHVSLVSNNIEALECALQSFSDSEIRSIAYAIEMAPPSGCSRIEAKKDLLNAAIQYEKLPILAGELVRRNPTLLGEECMKGIKK